MVGFKEKRITSMYNNEPSKAKPNAGRANLKIEQLTKGCDKGLGDRWIRRYSDNIKWMCEPSTRRVRQTQRVSDSTGVDLLLTGPNTSELSNVPYYREKGDQSGEHVKDVLVSEARNALDCFGYDAGSERGVTNTNSYISSDSFEKDLPWMVVAVSEPPCAKSKDAKSNIKCPKIDLSVTVNAMGIKSRDSGFMGRILVGRGNRWVVSNKVTSRIC